MPRNKYFLAGLGGLLLIVLIYNIAFFSGRGKSIDRPSAVPGTAVQGDGDRTSPALAQSPESALSGDWRRDPFWYPDGARRTSFSASGARAPKAERGLRLEGTTMKEDKSYALISGKVYGVGDRVAGQEIVAINDSSVTMKGAKGARTMNILTRSTEKE